ncbi:Ig-like domain-containing protein [Candidatus Palauibacter sp.]|uniref:Ig-like domain-containing protein n=1 Tax=Candidatus Palauibacter sp. TaxID=3101350 RepID=UPI003B52C842
MQLYSYTLDSVVTVTAADPQGLAAQQRFEVTVPNRPPEAVGEIPARTVSIGETVSVDVSAYFRDPDGDPLSYTAASSNPGVAGASAAGSSVRLAGRARGVVTVVVTATDPQGLAVQQRFEVTVPNRAPGAVGEIPAQALSIGEAVSVDVSAYFRDPDGDPLSYAAASSNAGVVEASATASSVAVAALAAGVATVTVTATDPGGLSATSSFGVTVETSAPGTFHIELVFATSVTGPQEAAFRAAAERWMAILAPTDLPDVPVDRTLNCGSDPRFQRSVGTIDDVMAVVAVAEIDGPGGVLGRAGPCWLRGGSSLPFYGRIELDGADLDRLEQAGDLEELVLHEMGHVLGIGTIWDRLGLLRDPASDTRSPDTHFTGPLAIAAFDEAGGTGYTGARVPVENVGGAGSRNGHWRESVLSLELMTSYLHAGVREPLSAITIQSLADLGYDVDSTLAEPYRLPGADVARALEAAPRIPYGDDIWRGPLVFVDPDGRIMRVIPR